MPASVETELYTPDSGDKLRVLVFGQDTLSNNYIVDADGRVALPLIGAVRARGLTTGQLASTINARLAASYIREPSVVVEVKPTGRSSCSARSPNPGQYPYVPDMTVENAVAIAGGFTPRGYRYNVTVTGKIDGAPLRLTPAAAQPHPSWRNRHRRQTLVLTSISFRRRRRA